MKYVAHTGIYGIILKKSEILLIKKTRGPYTGLLDLPGGRSEKGETPEQTLIREIREETGVLALSWSYYDRFHTHLTYKQKGNEIDFRHDGIIYLIEEYDDANLIPEQFHEDVAGCLFCPVHPSSLLTPFANDVCRTISQQI